SHSSAAASQLLIPQHSWPHWLLNPSLSNRSANSQQGKVCSEGRYTAFRRPISSLFTYTDGLLQGYSDSARLEIDPPRLSVTGLGWNLFRTFFCRPRSCAAGTGWRDSLKGASRPGSHSSAAASQLLVPQHSWPHWLLNPSLSNRSANSQQGKVCSEGRYTAFRRPISSLFTYTD